MLFDETIERKLSSFINESGFATSGAVITDLDGTAVHEHKGQILIPTEVEIGLLRHYERGRPIILNSLRFPLSVIRTFGREWYRISNCPIPTVTLNGSLIGYVQQNSESELIFEERAAFPLSAEEINITLDGVEELTADGIKNLLIFYYPRDWRMGEIIWTPVAENVLRVKEKYLSASAVTSVEFEKLRAQMLEEEICMIFLLIDVPQDQLMAYQHTNRNNFITHKGVDKFYGACRIAELLAFNLDDCLGAGDTELDSFLSGVGLAILVGDSELKFQGLRETIRLNSSTELGALLFRASELAA